jgi:hypothetical protein
MAHSRLRNRSEVTVAYPRAYQRKEHPEGADGMALCQYAKTDANAANRPNECTAAERNIALPHYAILPSD